MVWTDLIQTIIMVGAMLLIIIKGTLIVGGFNEVLRINSESERIEIPS